ncbi:hypothetical protein TcCL_ESM10928 [Trypanosoma cruzi]|nr:hypothetical protein TcCL_ESM10928 [Trypanosoma cruzi]
MSPPLSAGTHSPHTPLQPTVVYASADAASTSGEHTHAELLRLPSISRKRDGARVVVVVGVSAFMAVSLGTCVVVVVVVVGAIFLVVVVVVVVFASSSLTSLSASATSLLRSGLFSSDLSESPVDPGEKIFSSDTPG